MSDRAAASADGGPRAQGMLGRPRPEGLVVLSVVGFYLVLIVISLTYLVLIVSMLVADCVFMVQKTDEAGGGPIVAALADPQIQYSIWLSMTSCTLSAIASVWVAVPLGYLVSR